MRGNSRLKPIVVGGFAIAVVALGALTVLKHHARHAADTTTPIAASLQAIGVDGGDTDVSAGAAAPAAMRRATAMSPIEVQDTVRRIIAERMRASDEQSRQNDRYKASLATSFRLEKKDPGWAGAAESELQRIATGPEMTASGVAAGNVAIDCRRTICHTTASFATGAQADDWVMLYMASVGTVLRGSAVSRSQNADGSVNVDIFSKAAS